MVEGKEITNKILETLTVVVAMATAAVGLRVAVGIRVAVNTTKTQVMMREIMRITTKVTEIRENYDDNRGYSGGGGYRDGGRDNWHGGNQGDRSYSKDKYHYDARNKVSCP